MSLVGGGSLLVLPELFSGLSRGGFLSSTGGCKTFSDDADGYCRGEAVGVVVLKRLEDALHDNDNVLAVIRGAARNSNAGTGSITHPGEDAQVALFSKLLGQAGVDANEVGYIEMHGTGTQVGDSVEMKTVQKVFSQSRSPDNPLHVGAVKAAVGHSEAASGIVSLLKVVLMLRKNKIPPQPGYPFALNHKFSKLNVANIRIADGQTELVAWPKGDGKRKLVINTFDAAGGNTSILIEDGPGQPYKHKDPRTHHIVICSARTSGSLTANKNRLRAFLTGNPETNLAYLAYTTTARRKQEVCREVYVVDTVGRLIQQLESPGAEKASVSKTSCTSVVFLFTGQSTQYTGMGSTLYHTSPRFRRTIDAYEALCAHNGLGSFIDIIQGTLDVTTCTVIQLQLAIVALEIALAHYWQSLGLQPSLVIGHSLGEYAALCVAGVLSVGDTLYLVYKRASLMQESCNEGDYSMLAVSLAAESTQLKDLCRANSRSSCEVSCINGPSSTVISGLATELNDLQVELKSRNIASTLLQVPYGFHSSQMDAIVDRFEAAATLVCFGQPTVPVVSTLTGTVENMFDASYLARQIRRPVDFLGAIRTCQAESLISNASFVVEVGPHPVCLGLLSAALPNCEMTSFASLHRKQDDWRSISMCLGAAHQAGCEIDWQEFHKDYLDCLRLIDLPAYAFDLKNYWVSYQPQVRDKEGRPPLSKQIPLLSSTCLQRVEYLSNDKSSAKFTSNTSETNLFRVIQGHIVDGIAICPASVFVDMAFTATQFLLSQNGIEVDISDLELANLSMTQALVVPRRDDDQVIRVTATIDKAKSSVSIQLRSSTPTSAIEHGFCRASIIKGALWKSEWSRVQRLVRSRVRNLIESSSRGIVHRLSTALVYKLFSTVVSYDRSYQAIEEAYIDENFDDAMARLSLRAFNLGTFTTSPYVVDSLVHLAGFILNGNPEKPHDDLHIAHHIGKMQIVGKLNESQPLTCYATIRETDGRGMSVCDVYVFDDSKLLALCVDIRFRRVSRSIFSELNSKTNAALAEPRIDTGLARRSSGRHTKNYDSSFTEGDLSSTASECLSSVPTSIDAPDICTVILDTVAENTGVSVEEMGSDSAFADIGVDSQMSVAILTSVKKRLGTELPAAFFTSFPTIADVRRELGTLSAQASPKPYAPAAQDAHFPRLETQSRPPKSEKDQTAHWTAVLLRIVAIELGIDMDELTPSTDFASVGIDSQLSIKILSKFKYQTGIELPAAFFNDNKTVSDAKGGLRRSAATSSTAASDPLPNNIPTAALVRHGTKLISQKTPRTNGLGPSIVQKKAAQQHVDDVTTSLSVTSLELARPAPESRAILIQGNPRSTSPALFLVTDGSGSVAAYIHLPPLPGGRRIYALESPFLDHPEDYTLTMQEMAKVFVKSIRRIQSQGPYLLGGWSAGSIYAYEIAYQLAVLAGETITGLIIIDMRVPRSIPEVGEVTMDLVEKTGAFTGINRASNFLDGLSEKQKMHLTVTVRAIVNYDPIPFPQSKQPRQTHIIWATKGLNDSPNPEERNDRFNGPAAMGRVGGRGPLKYMTEEEFEIDLKSWFFSKRYTFETNGWEDLVGDNIVVRKVDGGEYGPRMTSLTLTFYRSFLHGRTADSKNAWEYCLGSNKQLYWTRRINRPIEGCEKQALTVPTID
jgi:iterative type I PKS product template protein